MTVTLLIVWAKGVFLDSGHTMQAQHVHNTNFLSGRKTRLLLKTGLCINPPPPPAPPPPKKTQCLHANVVNHLCPCVHRGWFPIPVNGKTKTAVNTFRKSASQLSLT